MNLLKDLNEAQRQAVEYVDGPSLVIAGAGSGKTRVLTYKIAYLLSQGMKPWSILALTFTNKAAREMKERIGSLVGKELASHLYMGTFHSIFSRILRAEAEHLGYNSNFTIYDEADSRSLIKAIIKEMALDDKVYKPAAVHGKISMAKNGLMGPEAYINDSDIYQRDLHAKMPAVGKIFATYVQRCKQANAMDFDDLLVLTFRLFEEHEDIRQKYASRFDFVLVDEYQDTNHAQMRIVMQLCKEKQRVCAVGDDSQSIYSFRGANIDNILQFRHQFEGAKLFKLERNYRSTQFIVDAANSLIKHNRNQIPKEVYSENDKGEKLLYKPAYSDKEEALIVARDIKRIKRQDGCEYSDFAILYRTNSQSRSFEEEFIKQGLPYRIFGGLSFYQRKEIKDIIGYFRLVANPDDEEAFKRIVNYPARGIGATTLQKIADCARNHDVSFWDVLCEPVHYGLSVNKGTLTKLENFRLLIAGFIEKSNQVDIYELGEYIIKESGISKDIYGGKDADDISRQENLEEFLNGMQTFVEEHKEEGDFEHVYLTDYLQEVALLSDLDSKGESDEPRVSLMTIHAAKGLEFPTVFVVGLEENIFPNPLSAASLRELEEERRLLYVAITRAEKHCILTNAKNRFRFGKMEFDNPSRFLNDIDPSLLQEENEAEPSFGGGYGGRMPWDKPVATQFVADPKPSYLSRKAEKPRFTSREELAQRNFKSVRAVNAARRILEQDATKSTSSLRASSHPVSAKMSRDGLSEGTRIEHQRFGVGTVLRIEGTGENTKATVEFVNSGTKQLLLKYAKFTVLG